MDMSPGGVILGSASEAVVSESGGYALCWRTTSTHADPALHTLHQDMSPGAWRQEQER